MTPSASHDAASLTIADVGLGKRGLSHAINVLLDVSNCWKVVAVCDPNDQVLDRFKVNHPSINCFKDVQQMIDYQQNGTIQCVSCAYVAAPHHVYGT